MKQYTNGNNLVKLGVIVADFLIMNLLLLGFIKWGGENFVPQYILAAKRITLFVANMAMILSEYLFHSKVHERNVENRRVVLVDFRPCRTFVCNPANPSPEWWEFFSLYVVFWSRRVCNLDS